MLASGYYNVIMEPRQDYHSFITVSDHGVITRLFQGHFSLIVGSLQKKRPLQYDPKSHRNIVAGSSEFDHGVGAMSR